LWNCVFAVPVSFCLLGVTFSVMGDLRRYTGTQRVQLVWSVVVGLFVVAVVGGLVPLPMEFGVIAGSISWFVGLVTIGLLDRRQWNTLVKQSQFEPATPTREVDLEWLLGDRSVYAEATVPSLLSQTHLVVSTPISDVNASFTVTFTYVGDGGTTSGVQTGVDALDDAFHTDGREETIGQILSREVATALLAIETPGTCTVTGDGVQYAIPFTKISPRELEAVSDVVVTIARHVEEVGSAAPTKTTGSEAADAEQPMR